ncbi:hypothetical protein ACS3SW_04445 [Roseobacteraceae bacterium S113]
MTEPLEARLNDALAAQNAAALIALYCEAAATANSDVQKGFFLTHAYVHALEIDAPEVQELRNRLVAMGRET